MTVPLIGITGKMGSGKDSVFERLDALYPGMFVRMSFAAKLKESVAALFDVTLEQLEEWKRDEMVFVKVEDMGAPGGSIGGECRCDEGRVAPPMTIREILQRYGTEAHRDVFGSDFWVHQGLRDYDSDEYSAIAVATDVRFPNEAQAIKDRGGEIWKVVGPDNDTGDHPSEAGISPSLIDRTIDNRVRDDGYDLLDSKLKQIVDTWGYRS